MRRFTETQKWDDPWFRRLRPEIKLLWQWILDRCDNAGVIDPDIELASFQIGIEYGPDTLSELGERIQKLPCGKWFIPKFISFQYGTLSKACKAHNPIFASLQKLSIEIDLKGYPYPMDRVQEEEKETDQEKEKEKEEEDRSKNRKRYATYDEVIAYAKSQPMAISDECIDAFFDRMEEIGWVDDRGLPLANWQARFRRYATNWANNAANTNFRTRYWTKASSENYRRQWGRKNPFSRQSCKTRWNSSPSQSRKD
jgi:hypothetical protein